LGISNKPKKKAFEIKKKKPSTPLSRDMTFLLFFFSFFLKKEKGKGKW